MGWDRGGGGVDGLRDVKTSFGVAFLKRELERFLPLLPCRPTGDREKTGHGPTDRRTGMTKKKQEYEKNPPPPSRSRPSPPPLPWRLFLDDGSRGDANTRAGGRPSPALLYLSPRCELSVTRTFFPGAKPAD